MQETDAYVWPVYCLRWLLGPWLQLYCSAHFLVSKQSCDQWPYHVTEQRDWGFEWELVTVEPVAPSAPRSRKGLDITSEAFDTQPNQLWHVKKKALMWMVEEAEDCDRTRFKKVDLTVSVSCSLLEKHPFFIYSVKAHMMMPLSPRGKARENIASLLREATAIMANDNCSADVLYSMTSGSCGFTTSKCRGEQSDLYTIHMHKSLWFGRSCIMWRPQQGGRHYMPGQTMETEPLFFPPHIYVQKDRDSPVWFKHYVSGITKALHMYSQ